MPGIIASLAALLNSQAYQRAQEKKLVKKFVDNEMIRFDRHVAEILDSIERMEKDLFFYCNVEKNIPEGHKGEVYEYIKLEMKHKAVNAILTKGIERTKNLLNDK
jgi:hypothetical protein